jgi:hypothetical protein
MAVISWVSKLTEIPGMLATIHFRNFYLPVPVRKIQGVYMKCIPSYCNIAHELKLQE